MELFIQLDNVAGAAGLLAQRAQHLTDQELAQAFADFLGQNDGAWQSFSQLDMERLATPLVRAREFELNLRLVCASLQAKDQVRFWELVCMLGGRDPIALRELQHEKIHDAFQQFAEQLAQVGLNLERNDLYRLIQASRVAIEQQQMTLLPMQLPVPASCLEHFWAHMLNCFNLINPFEQITLATPDAGDKFVSKLMQVVGGMGDQMSEPNLDLGGLLQQITGDQSFMNDMASMFGGEGGFDPSMIGTVVNKFTRAIGGLGAMDNK